MKQVAPTRTRTVLVRLTDTEWDDLTRLAEQRGELRPDVLRTGLTFQVLHEAWAAAERGQRAGAPMTAVHAVEAEEPPCTCGQPGTFWGHCDACELDRWVTHRCPFPCDDVTCENGALCLSCITGEQCPSHDSAEYEDYVRG